MSHQDTERVGFIIRRQGTPVIRLVLIALIIVLGLLAILPITQWLSVRGNRQTVRSVDTVSLPPPEVPPEPPPPPPEEKEEKVDDLEQPPPPMSISQLEMALNPGMGGAAAMVELGEFSTAADAVAELDIFSVADLDRTPRRVKTVLPNYPVPLQIQKIGGVVKLKILIDERGNVQVQDVLQSPHPDLAEETRIAVNQWKFEPPMKDGKPVRAYYEVPIRF